MDPRLQRRMDDQQQVAAQRSSQQMMSSNNAQQMHYRNSQQPNQTSLRDERRQQKPSRDSMQDQQHHHNRDSSNSQQQMQSHRPQPQQQPQGPPKRNKHLQEPEVDAFQPRYTLAFEQPDIPVRPKLFRYRLDAQKSHHAYEFSSVEMNREHLINVDYNMGMRVDLVDRDVYQLNPSGQQSDLTIQQLDQMRQKLLNDKDKFILSDKDTFVETKAKKQKLTAPPVENALIRTQSTQSQSANRQENEKVIMTDPKFANYKDLAIKQIERGFESNKRIKVGIQKPGKPGVTAKKVMDVIPCFQSVPQQLSLVVNDDEFDEQSLALNRLNNGQLMYNFDNENDQDNWHALYKFQSSNQLPDDLYEVCLGKRKSDQELWAQELGTAVQLEHVRDYTCSVTVGGSKGEKADYFLFEDTKNGCLRYVAIERKMVLNKRKRAKKDQMISQAENDDLLYESARFDQQQAMNQTDQAKNIVIAARGYEKKELHTSKQSYLTKVKSENHKPLDINDATFESKKALMEMEKTEAQNLKSLFKIQTNDQEEDDDQKMIKEDSQDDEIDLFGDGGEQSAKQEEAQPKKEKVVTKQESSDNNSSKDLENLSDDDEGLFF